MTQPACTKVVSFRRILTQKCTLHSVWPCQACCPLHSNGSRRVTAARDVSWMIYVPSQLLVTPFGCFTSYHNCTRLQQFTSRCITTCVQDDCSLRLSPSPHILFHTDTVYHRGHCSRDRLKSALRPSQTLCNISFVQFFCCFFF